MSWSIEDYILLEKKDQNNSFWQLVKGLLHSTWLELGRKALPCSYVTTTVLWSLLHCDLQALRERMCTHCILQRNLQPLIFNLNQRSTWQIIQALVMIGILLELMPHWLEMYKVNRVRCRRYEWLLLEMYFYCCISGYFSATHNKTIKLSKSYRNKWSQLMLGWICSSFLYCLGYYFHYLQRSALLFCICLPPTPLITTAPSKTHILYWKKSHVNQKNKGSNILKE